MEDLYSRAKTEGYKAQSAIQLMCQEFKDKIEVELGRELTIDEKDEIEEGFYNGVY